MFSEGPGRREWHDLAFFHHFIEKGLKLICVTEIIDHCDDLRYLESIIVLSEETVSSLSFYHLA